MKGYINMKHYVTYEITAKYVAEVEADNTDDAIALANKKFSEADFGEASDIDGEAIIVENENNDTVWEKQNC